jgi:hypothetical protein
LACGSMCPNCGGSSILAAPSTTTCTSMWEVPWYPDHKHTRNRDDQSTMPSLVRRRCGNGSESPGPSCRACCIIGLRHVHVAATAARVGRDAIARVQGLQRAIQARL